MPNCLGEECPDFLNMPELDMEATYGWQIYDSQAN